MTRIACIAGARPNFMKVKPVLDALEARGAHATLVHTGQHYDPSMSDVFFADLGLRKPDASLGVGAGSQSEQTARVMTAFEDLLPRLDPQTVVVVGDVTSTLACALVAAKSGRRVAHVEAGLRSRDWEMPEEVNRVVTDRVSDYLLAPSQDAVDNLRAEGYRNDQIHLVGNVMIDTLLSNVDRARRRPTVSDHGLEAGQYCLVTLHRPSNVDNGTALRALLLAIGRIAEFCPVIFPVHPRTKERLEASAPPGVQLIEPLGYLDFLALEAAAGLVITDSGGVQEETTVLGVPCLTARKNTERPVTVTEGTNQVVGTNPELIVAAAREVLATPPEPRRPALWDGHAGARIADVLMSPEVPLRPTELAH